MLMDNLQMIDAPTISDFATGFAVGLGIGIALVGIGLAAAALC